MSPSRAKAKRAPQAGWRNLTAKEIKALRQNGCTADDWRAIRVKEGFKPETVARCRFSGEVRLGNFSEPIQVSGVSLPSGVYDSHLHGVTVGDHALVQRVALLANYEIGPGASLWDCGEVTVAGETTFGNGVSIEVLNEGGGREVRIFDRLNAQFAYLLACYRHRPHLVESLEKMAAAYADNRRSSRGIIGAGARVCHCPYIRNVSIGTAAVVEGASRLENGSILSKPEAPAHVGAGVVAADFIVSTGAVVDGRAIITKTFIGQGCRIGRQFSAENVAFFANGEGFHGETLALLAGPYTVTHHKSTLLIAGLLSFYNAGSGSNQSNHMYKLGPVHQGILERGAKTGSFSYLLWPARVGPFSVVIGKHYANFDCRDLPFSYIFESNGESVLVPAINLFTVGTKRDGEKWPARDRRKDPEKHDRIHFAVLSPFTAGRMLRGMAALAELAGRSDETVIYCGLKIKRSRCAKAQEQYAMALDAYLGGLLAERLEKGKTLAASSAIGRGEWVDILGLLAPQSEAEALCAAIEKGDIADLPAFEKALDRLHQGYAEWEWNWACDIWRQRSGKAPAEMDKEDKRRALAAWREAVAKWNSLVAADAEKEFGESSRIGFGIDGDAAVRDCDFAAVRGDAVSNKFILGLKKDAESVVQRAEALLKVL